MPGAWLVLPTFNEAENIEPIIRAALPQLASSGLPHRILVVDDNSPDGTGSIADRLASEIEEVEVLHRERKEGIGPAYLAGFERALAEGADLLLEMDSDFSHDPADLPRLIAAAADADLVLGSRYVPGGGVTDWGLGRRLISRGGSLYAKLLLGIPVNDLTGGFKCFRREVLERARPLGRGHRRLRLPDRDDLPHGEGGLPRDRGADPFQRPAGRIVQDVCEDRHRGVLEGPGASVQATQVRRYTF